MCVEPRSSSIWLVWLASELQDMPACALSSTALGFEVLYGYWRSEFRSLSYTVKQALYQLNQLPAPITTIFKDY